MGLDQFAYRVKFSEDNLEKSIYYLNQDDCYSLEQLKEVEDIEEIHYWRKNRFIHNWIEENVFLPKAEDEFDFSISGDFNNIYVRLNEFDLKQLKEEILSGKIKDYSTQGFFFGSQDYDDRMKREDLKFVENSLKEIREGYMVYYYSSW